MSLKIKIEGMTCHRCEAKVRDRLNDLGLGEVVAVSFKDASAVIQASVFTDESDYRQAIESLGYTMGHCFVSGAIDLSISGLRCEKCVSTVKNLISETAGVVSVDVVLESGVASIEGKFDLTTLIVGLANSGYPLNVGLAPAADVLMPDDGEAPGIASGSEFMNRAEPLISGESRDANIHSQEIIQLAIVGMSCASCVSAVEAALMGVEGTFGGNC